MPASKMSEKIDKAEQDFARWQQENPGKKFRDYYAEIVTRQLDAGKPHATLGKNLKGEGTWDESGRSVFELIVEEGLRPEHVCVDYGCGSLRIGQHVMNYVDPGNYWGLDITDRFYRDGVEMIGPEKIAERRPNLRVIAPDALAETRAAQPDLIFAMAVLIHVPPPELDELLDNITGIVLPKTRAYMTYKSTDETMRYSGRSWAYPEDLITAKIEERGARVEFRPRSSVYNEGVESEVRRGWLVITRPED